MYQLFALSPVGPPPEASCTSALKILTKEYTIGHSTQLHTNYENIRRKLFAYAIGLTSGCGCKLIKNGEKKKKSNLYITREREWQSHLKQELLTTAENVTMLGFKSGASKRIKAPLLPICNTQITDQHYTPLWYYNQDMLWIF